MIIVSQEKHLLNYDNVIEICKTFGNEKDVSIIATTINDDIVLGEYDTEERADEVLEEITQYYKKFEYCRQITIGQRQDDTRKNELGVYEMPKE